MCFGNDKKTIAKYEDWTFRKGNRLAIPVQSHPLKRLWETKVTTDTRKTSIIESNQQLSNHLQHLFRGTHRAGVAVSCTAVTNHTSATDAIFPSGILYCSKVTSLDVCTYRSRATASTPAIRYLAMVQG
ncbi:hypothetical protein QTP88_011915 [Uroleucon formosanum]